MRFLKTVLLIAALQSVLVLASPGQSPSPTQPVATPTPAATATDSDEIRILKAEVANQEKYNDKIVGSFATLVQTAIGVFIFLFGAAFSISYVSALKVRESDRRELLANIEERYTKMLAEFSNRVETVEKEYKADLAEFQTMILFSTDESHKKLTNEVIMLDHRMTRDNAERFKGEGNYSDALISLSACVALSKKIDIVRFVQSDLRAMDSLLKEFPGKSISEGVHHQIKENLKNLPPQVVHTLRKVNSKLDNLFYPDENSPGAQNETPA